MPTTRNVHEYVSLDEAYGTEDSSRVSVDSVYAAFPPWKVRMQQVAQDAQQSMDNEAHRDLYVAEQWRNYGEIFGRAKFTGDLARDLSSPDPQRRRTAGVLAEIKLMESLTPDQIAQTEEQFRQKFLKRGALDVSLKEFLKQRQRAGFYYSQDLRKETPGLEDDEVRKKTADYLRKQGFDAAEWEGKLPDVLLAPPPDDDPYWWKATKEVAAGLPMGVVRGAADIFSAGWSLGLAIGEGTTDRRHGDRLLAKAKDPYYGHERVAGMPVGRREDNVYRLFRLAHEDRLETMAPMPPAETFLGQLAGGLGQAIPQLAMLASGAGATRGLSLAGNTTRALAIKASTIGTMFALEGSSSFRQYMQYAEKEGIDPHEASASALLGAAAYASAASVLEYFGPFNALEKHLPGVKRRMIAMALMGATEAGTEALQAITQEAIAYGLDFKQATWENFQGSLQQAAMEGIVGGIAGGVAGGVTFQSPIVETPDGSGLIAADPDAALTQIDDILGNWLDPWAAPEIAGLLPSPETVTPEAAYPRAEQPYQDPQAATRRELSQIGVDDQVEIDKGLTIDGIIGPRVALADALGLEKRPWFAKLNAELLGEVEAAIQANNPDAVRELIPRLDEALYKAQAAVETREGESKVRTKRVKAGLEAAGPLPAVEQPKPRIGDVFRGQKPKVVNTPATSLQTQTEMSPPAKAAVEARPDVAKDAAGHQTTTPHVTYEQGSKNLKRTSRNVWVRPAKTKSNKGRTLLVQWSSDMLQSGTREVSDDYYDALYRTRQGYARADDFWELPQWMGHAAHNIPDSDVYVVRDIDEAVKFLNEAGYDDVAFSVLDVNKNLVQQLVAQYEGSVSVGGYAAMDALSALDNVTVHDSIQDWVKSKGLKWSPGVSYRHFPGTPVIPRVTLSEGCLHKCAFCIVPKELHQVSTQEVADQLESFADLDAELVYVNDKTFGQAPNYTDLIAANEYMRAHNPNFKGFIIQTTAAQMQKLSIEFLHRAGVAFVELGVESYNDSVLKANKKPANERLIDAAVQKLREAEIAFIPNILIGLPQETAETYAHTLDFLRANRDIISHFNAYNLAVYAGTDLAATVGDAVSDSDLDENRIAKSFHDDPQLHQDFADQLFALGQELLAAPPISAGSNAQLTLGDHETVLADNSAPNTIRPGETPEETMTRIIFGNLTESDEINLPPEPASTPEEASNVEDIPDGTPERTFMDGLVEILKTEEGAIPLADTGRAIAGGIAGAAGEIGLLRGGIHSAVLDESVSLQGTAAGRETIALIDEAESRHLLMRGQLLPLYDEALASLPWRKRGAVRKWSYAMRDDGQTNWSTLIEHPERVQNIPEGVDVVLEAYRVGVLETLGDAAVAAKIPQLQWQEPTEEGGEGKWVVAPFQRAEGGRYLRAYTREGMDLMAFQEGHHLWDALIEWGKAHPDRNPGLDFDDPARLRAQLDGAKQSGKTKKAGSLEFVRIFKELPVALKDANGKWVPIQQRDPRSHYLGAVENQSRRIALWTSATDMLVPRYGTFNEETGRMEFRQPSMHPELTDVDGLLAHLRKDTASQSKAPRRAENAFNVALSNYERTNYGGYENEFLTSLGDTATGAALAAAYNISMASVLQLAPLFDATNPLRASASVGWRGMFAGYGSATIDMLRHPLSSKKLAAEYQAMGAVIEGHADWVVHRDTWFRDVFAKNLPQALMAVGRYTEVRGQFTVARMFDRWVQSLNSRKNLSSNEAAYLAKHLRLTPDQIAEISRGEMSQSTRAKVIQTGVKTVSGLTESSHRKGRIQNSPMGRLAVPFLSVVNSVSRGAVRHVGDMATDIKNVTAAGATSAQRTDAAKSLGRSAWRMLSFVAAIAGSGFLQRYLRRAVTGRKLVEPEDPDQWTAILSEALAEGGIFGPYYRVFEAAKYGNNLYEMPTKLIFPLGITIEVAMAVLGEGKYADTPWARRLTDLGIQYSPPWKAARNWIARVKYPSRENYNEARKLVRKYNKDVRGVEPQYGTGRNFQYLQVFEAVRDGDRGALAEAMDAFWASAKEKGWDEDEALKRLKSSLSARRPVNLKEEARKDFLGKLPESVRNRVLVEEERFGRLMEKALVSPGEPDEEVEDGTD